MSARSIVIIRAAGERTESACIEAVSRQARGWLGVEVVRERPFWKALSKSIGIACRAETRWAVCVDADVLVRNGCLERAIVEASQCRHGFFMLNFRVLDRLMGGEVSGGLHLYSGKLLRQALELLPQVESALRPENALCAKMAERGYPTVRSKYLVGLHDFEQYYRDIYRKMFVKANKMGALLPYLFARCNQEKNRIEHRVALAGLIDGIAAGAAGRRASLNVAYYREMADRVLSEAGIAERGPLTAFDATRVDEVVDSFVPDELYRAHRSMLAADGEVCWFGQDAPWTAKFVRRVRKALQRRLEALERRLGGSA
ncbi:MAG: hypothetical protein KatS3mg005_1263 [Bryobacteraceae bacterium]|nr:MAG: hypothetical protein KatS3mg005_1263 [Bryobacteraceae bacterium]